MTKKVSWMWRGKKYEGTLLPDKEDKDNRYARTHNGKIKTLPKKKPKKKISVNTKNDGQKKGYKKKD